MGWVLSAFANGAIMSAGLTAAVWFALWLTPRQRVNAATRYAIWWATLAATLALPVLYLRTPRLEDIGPIQSSASTLSIQETLPDVPGVVGRRTAAPIRSDRSRRAIPAVPLNVAAIRGPQWIGASWLIASLLLLVRLMVSWVLLDRRRARAMITPAILCAQAEAWLARYRRAGVRLASSTEIATPIAVGPLHPSILIPSRLLEELESDDLEQIVLHESAHLVRRDDYALLVERAIEALFALHPVVRWITRQIDLEREVACDDFVVEATGQARSYAGCLTRMVELCGGVRTSLAGAAAVKSRSHLAERVDRLLDKRRHTGTRILKARLVGMVAVLSAAAWTAGRTPRLVAFAMPPSTTAVVVRVETPLMPAARSFAGLSPAAPKGAILTASAVTPVIPPALVESPEPAAPPAPQRQVQAGTSQIQVVVEVADPMNRFVTGLGRESFRIFEDGVEQQVSQLSNEELPVSVGIVVDVSGSMGAKLESERAAVFEFLKSARPADEFFLVPFNQDPVLAVPFTHDTAAIENGLRNTRAVGGTSLRDAVYMAIQEMKHARNARRAILIVSDGSDNSSRYSPSEFRSIVSEADLQLYAIDLSDRPNPRAFAGILDVVNQPGALDANIDNVAAAPSRAGRIAAGLRDLYVLTYTSTNAIRDGGYRKVQVQLVPTAGLPPLRLTHRSGYFAR